MARASVKVGEQLCLDVSRRPRGRGGWRPNAGRPRVPGSISHGRRPAFTARVPQHVTLRLVGGVRSLRRDRTLRVVHDVLRAAAHLDDFRVVEFNVLSNHLHLIVEAADERALSRGMHALTIRLARRLNALLGRHGRLFAHRYHTHALRTPREVRNALRYVLLNARHHAAQQGQRLARTWIDPWSSAPWFDGWRDPIRV
jgi:putative transposase